MTNCVCSPTGMCAYHEWELKKFQRRLKKLQRYERDLANHLYDIAHSKSAPSMPEVNATVQAMLGTQLAIKKLCMDNLLHYINNYDVYHSSRR